MEKLEIRSRDSLITLTGIHGIATHTNKMLDISIFSIVKENTKFNISCCVLDKITNNMPHYTLIRENIAIPPGRMLADPHFNVPGQIDILLGADVYYSIVHGTPLKYPEMYCVW